MVTPIILLTSIFTLTPNKGYGTPSVTCTNNQTGTYKNGVLTVQNVTSDKKFNGYIYPGKDNSSAIVYSKKRINVRHIVDF